MAPKGKLIIIGGAINTGSFAETQFGLPQNMNFFERGILKRITVESVKGNDSRFEIMTTASLIPEKVGEEYIKAFAQLDVHNVGVLNIGSREEANNPAHAERIKTADVIIFTGGDQLRLSSISAEQKSIGYCSTSIKIQKSLLQEHRQALLPVQKI
jgi:cyanophycinase